MAASPATSKSCAPPLFNSVPMSVSRRSLCDLCRLGPIVGPHYKCSNPRCKDLDLCVACVTSVKHQHHGCFYMVAGESELISVISPAFQQKLLPAVHARFQLASAVKRLQGFYSGNQKIQEERSALAKKARKVIKGKLAADGTTTSSTDSASAATGNVAHPFLAHIPPALMKLGRRVPPGGSVLQGILTGIRSVLQNAGMPKKTINETFETIQGNRADGRKGYDPRRRNALARDKSRKEPKFPKKAAVGSAPANSALVSETLVNILAVIQYAWDHTWEAPDADEMESSSHVSPLASDASSPAPQAPNVSERRVGVAVSAIMDHVIALLQRLELAYLHAAGLGSGSNFLEATDEEVAAASLLPHWLQQDDRAEYPSHAGLAVLFWTWMGTSKPTATSCSASDTNANQSPSPVVLTNSSSSSAPPVTDTSSDAQTLNVAIDDSKATNTLGDDQESKQATINQSENEMFQVLLGEEIYDEFRLRHVRGSSKAVNNGAFQDFSSSSPSSPPDFHLCSGTMAGVGPVSMIPLTMMLLEDKPPRCQSCPVKPLGQYMQECGSPIPIEAVDGDNWSAAMEKNTAMCVFVSHHWRQSVHPDADGKDWRILQKWMWDTIAGVVDVLAILLVRAGLSVDQLHRWMTQPQGKGAQPAKFLHVEHHYRDGVIDADMLTSLVRLTLTHLIRSQHPVSTLESTAQRVSLCHQVAARIFFWFDYTCIPQKPRTEEQTIQFRHVLRHLASLQLSCSSTLVTNHAESDYDVYLRRAWCVAEWVLVDHCSFTHSLSSPIAADLIDRLEAENEDATEEDELAGEESGEEHEDSSTDGPFWRNPNIPLPVSLTTYRFQIRHAILFKMLRVVGSSHQPLPNPRGFLRDHLHLNITSISKDESSSSIGGSSQSSAGSAESAAELELVALAICRVLWTAACRYFNENDLFFMFEERLMDAWTSDEIILAGADFRGDPTQFDHALDRLRWLVHATENNFRKCKPLEHASNRVQQAVSSAASVPATETVDDYEFGFEALPLISAYRQRVASEQNTKVTSFVSSQQQPAASSLTVASDDLPISPVPSASPICENKSLSQRTLRILFYTPLPPDAIRFECDSRLWLTATIDILTRFATAVQDSVKTADGGCMLAEQYDRVHIGLTCSLLSKAKQRGDTILVGNSQDTGCHLIDFLVPKFGEGYEL